MKQTPQQKANWHHAKLRIKDAARFGRMCWERYPVDILRIGGWL